MAGEAKDEGWAGPLAGVRVLDFTRVLAGPFASQALGDLGAEILKIESPQGGDETRRFPPYFDGSTPEAKESHYFLALNRNKKSLVIDLKQEAGRDLVRRLVADSDVLLENFRPGVMERLGLGYEALAAINPKLVYCSISGFGQSGPLRDKPSYDIVTQAMSGVLSVNGERGQPPVKLGVPLGDMIGGVYGPIGILSALHERNVTGRGRYVDISLHDGLMAMLGYLAQLAFLTGEDPTPVGSGHPNIVPYGSFPASDGHIIIAALSDGFWVKLCHCIGRPELPQDPRFAGMADRRENRDAIEAIISEITRTRTVAEWETALLEHDVPHAPILGVQAALSHPQAAAREMVVSADHPELGEIRMTGRPIKFPGARQAPLAAPPLLGQHTAQTLRDLLGCGEAELEALMESGVIGTRQRER